MQLVSKITPATFDFNNQLGNSWVQYFLSRVFLEFNIFLCGYLVGPKYFFGCRLHGKDWQKTEIHKYISNRVFYSRLISAVVSSVYISASATKLVLLVFLVIFFFSIRISSLVTIIDNNCKTTWKKPSQFLQFRGNSKFKKR